jgi:hypothetical protein
MKKILVGVITLCAGVQGWGMVPGTSEIGRHFRSIPPIENGQNPEQPQFDILGIPIQLLAPGMPDKPPYLAPGLPSKPPKALC